MKKLVAIICVLVLVAGIAITACDGVMLLFGCARVWQYLFNFAFVCLGIPGCIMASGLPRKYMEGRI